MQFFSVPQIDLLKLFLQWLYLQLFPSYSGDMTSLAEKMNYFEELATGIISVYTCLFIIYFMISFKYCSIYYFCF